MKHTIVGLTLFLLITSAWAGTFMDDFEDGNMDEWSLSSAGAGGTWKIENGELILEGSGGASYFGFGIEGPDWKDYTIKVKLKITKHVVTAFAEQAGMVFRADEEASYGVLLGTLGGANIKRLHTYHCNLRLGGVPQHLQTVPFDWEVNTWYVLKAVIEGDNFKYYVNDDLIMEYMDATYPAGGVGLVVTASTAAHFDDFCVTGEDIPDNFRPVFPKAKIATKWGAIKANHSYRL